MIITELDKAYAAGFFDGEGCIMLHKTSRSPKSFLRITVGQNELAPLLWLKERWGGTIEIDRTRQRNVYHRWVIQFKKARQFLVDVTPFCKVKCPPYYSTLLSNYLTSFSLKATT